MTSMDDLSYSKIRSSVMGISLMIIIYQFASGDITKGSFLGGSILFARGYLLEYFAIAIYVYMIYRLFVYTADIKNALKANLYDEYYISDRYKKVAFGALDRAIKNKEPNTPVNIKNCITDNIFTKLDDAIYRHNKGNIPVMPEKYIYPKFLFYRSHSIAPDRRGNCFFELTIDENYRKYGLQENESLSLTINFVRAFFVSTFLRKTLTDVVFPWTLVIMALTSIFLSQDSICWILDLMDLCREN